MISINGYDEASIDFCKKSLKKATVVLCKLEEIIILLSKDDDLNDFFRKKIDEVIKDKNPLYEPFGSLSSHL